MVGAVLAVLQLVLLILLVYPIKIVLKMSLKASKKSADRERKRLDEIGLMAQDDAKVAKENDQYAYSNRVLAKYKTKRAFSEGKIKSREAIIKAGLSIVTFLQWIMSLSSIFFAILFGVGVAVALLMSTLIPSWKIIIDQQGGGQQVSNTNSGSSKSSSKSSKKGDSDTKTGEPKGGSDAVKGFIYLLNAGVPKNWAAGQVGNWMAETGGGSFNFNPTIGNISNGYGITQWTNGRYTKLMGLKDHNSLATQATYTAHEMKHSYPAVWSHMKAHPNENAGQAAYYLATTYEACASWARSKRIGYANTFYKAYVSNNKYKNYIK